MGNHLILANLNMRAVSVDLILNQLVMIRWESVDGWFAYFYEKKRENWQKGRTGKEHIHTQENRVNCSQKLIVVWQPIILEIIHSMSERSQRKAENKWVFVNSSSVTVRIQYPTLLQFSQYHKVVIVRLSSYFLST